MRLQLCSESSKRKDFGSDHIVILNASEENYLWGCEFYKFSAGSGNGPVGDFYGHRNIVSYSVQKDRFMLSPYLCICLSKNFWICWLILIKLSLIVVQTETTLLVFVLCIKAIVASRAITIDDSHLGDVEASKVAATLATGALCDNRFEKYAVFSCL